MKAARSSEVVLKAPLLLNELSGSVDDVSVDVLCEADDACFVQY